MVGNIFSHNTDPEIQKVLELLATVKDPEIPVLSVLDLGIVRDVRFAKGDHGNFLEVDITPTYSGCPAMQAIEDEVQKTLRMAGFQNVKIGIVFAPAWTTDWMSTEAKEKLKTYGISPPAACNELVQISSGRVTCPFCSSDITVRKSEFGSTPCKSLYFCSSCNQPFENFKPV